MDTSLAAVNAAILENLQRAGEIGLHTDDLIRILGFEAKGQILPRLYKLQGQNLVQRMDGHQWKIVAAGSPPPALVTTSVQMGEAWCNDQFISYKNILQEYCQKKNLPIPSYKSEKKSIGYFGLVSFGFELMKSQVAMPTAKEADQRVAFEALKNAQVIPNDAKFNEPSEVELPTKKRKSEVLKASDSMRKFSLIDGEESLSMKNKLQEIAQKSGLKMPEYHVSGTNQNFMATVSFQGRSFSSTRAFAKKKPAEHDAANVALYELGHVSKPPYGWVTRRPMLPGNTQQYQQSIGNAGAKSKGSHHPNENFKNKLQEYMQSKKYKIPEYETTYETIGTESGFVSKVSVEGREYISAFKKTKKEAEKDAACVALLTLGILTE